MENVILREADIIYHDNHLLVANKKAGLLTQADSAGDIDLLTLAKSYIKIRYDKPGDVFLGLVQRLDRPVSGVIVLARTSKAAARLSDQFRQRLPKKRYLALVEGKCYGQGVCRDYLVKKKQRVYVVNKDTARAQYAELRWRVIGYQSNPNHCLMEIELKTGRPHQIRVQLARLGYPIVGDLRYGAKGEFDGKNMALHCGSLELTHPVLKKQMRWGALPPKTWPVYFEQQYQDFA